MQGQSELAQARKRIEELKERLRRVRSVLVMTPFLRNRERDAIYLALRECEGR
jgi:hypothetical protein